MYLCIIKNIMLPASAYTVSLTILLEWQLYMYLCILNVRYVLLYTLVRQK